MLPLLDHVCLILNTFELSLGYSLQIYWFIILYKFYVHFIYMFKNVG